MKIFFKWHVPKLLSLLILLCWQCRNPEQKKSSFDGSMEKDKGHSTITKSPYGSLPDGREVHRYTFKNGSGTQLEVITLGGIITHWSAPDRTGLVEDIVLGFDGLEGYLGPHPFFGTLVGRYANRIAQGRFELDGKTYRLETNNGPNHLHGGSEGFDKALWEAEILKGAEGPYLLLRHQSPDGDQGYPGKLDIRVTYTLTPENALDIIYEATTDKPTIVNLTQHTYFNLSGALSETVLDHEMQILAESFLPVNEDLIPTGEQVPVDGTPFDFRQPKGIGEEIGSEHPQLQIGGGYDHCWVLNGPSEGFRKIAEAYHPGSGRVLTVHSDEPGVQFYTGNFLEGRIPGKAGLSYQPHSGFCLETQHFPDSPNQSSFPSVRLDPGEVYRSRTRFRLSTR